MYLTPCEKRFIEVLEVFKKLTPDAVHINPKDRKERLRREFCWLTKTEVDAMIVKMSEVMIGLSDVVEAARQGGMRHAWISGLKDVVTEVTDVFSCVHDAAELKLH